MILNYLKIAWRYLVKNKVFSLINVLGLTIGITVCMMIFLFILNGFSVDRFHKQGKNIYRVMRNFEAGQPGVPWLSGPYAPALLNDFKGEIKQAVRVMPSNDLFTYGTKSFNEKKVYYTDDNFFTFFSFPLLKGNPETALKDPNSVVISESTARKYFGSPEEAMGKVLEEDKEAPLKVTAVAKDVPTNSHLDFDIIVPISRLTKHDWFNVWINNNNFTYVLLDDKVTKEQVEKRLPAFLDKYAEKVMAQYGIHWWLSLSPLRGIYFEQASGFDSARHGDKKVVYIFLSIAVLILLIACINYMNLSTIRAMDRSKEVGLRKVMGALRGHLVWQFIGESLLLTMISCMLSFGLLNLLMPYYNQLLGESLRLSSAWKESLLFFLGILIVVGFLAGSYPAFFLSAFSPIQALKGKLNLGRGGSLLRQGLVVVQFSITVLLIVGTLVILFQMQYMKNKELGYDKEQTLVIPIDNNDIYKNRTSFKNELEANSNVISVASMSGEPGGFFDVHKFEVEGQHEMWQARTEFAFLDFVKTLGLKIISGRDFSPLYPTDSSDAVMISHKAATLLGWTPQEALGKWIKNPVRDTKRRTIIGVVEDFNYVSLKEQIDPLVISPSEDRRVVLVKLKPGNLQSSLDFVKQAYQKAAPLYPFEYSFLDEKFDMLYKTDIKQQTILAIFSGMAIFIACLGLFGLASFTASKRTKEIGVRKVLGSSSQNIVLLLSRDLLRPVLVATLFALPAGYLVMHNWLQHFAYRIDLSWWILVLAAGITFSIAFCTVSFRAIRAALANPADSLRNE